MSTGDMLAGGLGLLVGLVGVVAYAMGFKAGITRAFEAASQAVKEVFAKS
jgi:Flp pilus assembly pilin Flp